MDNRRPYREESSAIYGANAPFIEALYQQYLTDPASVDPSWREKFDLLQLAATVNTSFAPAAVTQRGLEETAWAALGNLPTLLKKHEDLIRLVEAYRTRGHLAANVNPLPLNPLPLPPDLDVGYYAFNTQDIHQLVRLDGALAGQLLTLEQLVQRLRQTYCGTCAVEFMHVSDATARNWILECMEATQGQPQLSPAERLKILERLVAAEGIERYLHRRYVGHKRFSLEGAEALIPMLDDLTIRACAAGVEELIIGMAHRGRLNVLVNILGKQPRDLFLEFEGMPSRSLPEVTAGDVKYHLGFSSDAITDHGPIHLVLAFNPSHLEIIDPVVEGSVRARQDVRGAPGTRQVLPVLIHGDASFAGQGVVMETLNMSQTPGYGTGGTVHIVVNNQIGFTTSDPHDARSTLYCTDIAKMIEAPVLHVNGDDPEAALLAIRVALDYRMRFRRDVFIDLVCYRRQGHNEADEPAVTQPVMYQLIRKHPSVVRQYAQRLTQLGICEAGEEQRMATDYERALEDCETVSRPLLTTTANLRRTAWQQFIGRSWAAEIDTGVPCERLQALAQRVFTVPQEFTLHPRVLQVLESRKKMAEGSLPLDWGFGETMAYASLLADGRNIRLSGQDVGRGTFFHRHAVIYDAKSAAPRLLLAAAAESPAQLWVYDSLLSEEAVLGFEYGYSSSDPHTLVIWEAQFGDFANGAQVVIDQFIASSEAKWGRLSGLVMLLPHGYEGQGAEHSSARLERYLQLCAEHNMQVCVPTTPAQMFHLLRRQILRQYRKPLIVLTPKSLLRHKLAVSPLQALANGRFELLIGDTETVDPTAVTRVIACAGKVYYELLEARKAAALAEHIAIIRVEQLYPFPGRCLRRMLAIYPNLRELIWCQEEPKNQGAWRQIKHRLRYATGPAVRLGYAGRPVSPAPAAGYPQLHAAQQQALLEAALNQPEPDDPNENGEEHED